jgi:hypothetical protein
MQPRPESVPREVTSTAAPELALDQTPAASGRSMLS